MVDDERVLEILRMLVEEGPEWRRDFYLSFFRGMDSLAARIKRQYKVSDNDLYLAAAHLEQFGKDPNFLRAIPKGLQRARALAAAGIQEIPPKPREKRSGRPHMVDAETRRRVAQRAIELRFQRERSDEIYQQLKEERICMPMPAYRTIRKWIREYLAERKEQQA